MSVIKKEVDSKMTRVMPMEKKMRYASMTKINSGMESLKKQLSNNHLKIAH